MRDWLARWQGETGDAYVLGLVRVCLGVLFFAQALRALAALQGGYFGDAFHWPFLPEVLVAPRAGYGALVVVQILVAVLVVAGPRARGALLASALLATYVLLCDRLDFHHNRWALACYAALLSFAPCDRSFRIGPPVGTRVGALWAARLAQAQVALVYVASGGSKLLDPAWRAGEVLRERFHLFGADALAAGVPRWLLDLLAEPTATSILAKLAIATELGLAVALWSRRGRVVALWWGVWFHLVIEATSRVEGFTWLTLAMYALFATPDVRARTLRFDASRPLARRLARVVGWLDWLARFAIEPWEPDPVGGHGIVVVDRDGTRATGLRALALVARCTPLLFPLWAPLALAASLTQGAHDAGASAGTR
jgi:hypothetical protein